jgi:hypothetical protein
MRLRVAILGSLLQVACASRGSTALQESRDASIMRAPDAAQSAPDAAQVEPRAPDAEVARDAGAADTSQLRELVGARVVEGRFVDNLGRELTLRGTNVKTEVLFDASFADGRTQNEIVPPWEDWDAPQIAALGFDFVRLCINWSGLEPQEGQFSDAYLDRLDEVIADLNRAGIYVLIDFHEDAWSKEIGEDGARCGPRCPLRHRCPGPCCPALGSMALTKTWWRDARRGRPSTRSRASSPTPTRSRIASCPRGASWQRATPTEPA